MLLVGKPQDYGVHVSGCLELYALACREHVALDKSSLEAVVSGILSGQHGGLHLPKLREVRCSDWEVERLSVAQVVYAAADASYG